LAAAARSLAAGAGHVGIVTGFVALGAEPPTAETDGPPGALFLARVLLELGRTVTLIADKYVAPLLVAGCDHWRLDRSLITEFPWQDPWPDSPARETGEPPRHARADAWVREFLASGAGARLTHLIAVERPGPSHTVESLALQPRNGPPPVDRFAREIPPERRNVCHNMRGESIDSYTAKTHRLFEAVAANPAVTTIGIGDGGNEIGMGRYPWEQLAERIPGGRGGLIACRIATDYTLTGGASNWAAYALAMAICLLRRRVDILRPLDLAAERRLLDELVFQGGAADGVTGRRAATVDGLPPDLYFNGLGELRTTLGLRR
jgi:hypothetical protein